MRKYDYHIRIVNPYTRVNRFEDCRRLTVTEADSLQYRLESRYRHYIIKVDKLPF